MSLICRLNPLLHHKSTKNTLRRHTTRAVSVTRCSQETQKFFFKRLESQGWEIRKASQSPILHPIAVQTWEAMEEVYGLGIAETPLVSSPWLEAFSGSTAAEGDGTVRLKLESKQITGSFKTRGAAHKLLSLTPEQLKSGIVTSSTGNHALAMLHSAGALTSAGRPVDLTIYLPSTVTPQKLAKLQSEAQKSGARIVTMGQDCVEAESAARSAAETSNGRLVYVSPYNDYAVAGGQGTVAVELLMSLPRSSIDAVFVPVGGGGLIAGIATLLKSIDPGIEIIGCQPEKSDVMRRSIKERAVVDIPWEDTLSDATAGGIEEDSITLDACRIFVDNWVTVSEPEIAHAMVGVHGHHGLAIEGAAGVAVAAFIKSAQRMRGKNVVIVVCGGNVSSETLDKAYALVKEKQKAGALF